MFDLIEVIVKDGDIHLHTEYNGEIVAFMRSRKKRFWDKNKREWVIPESEMENLIPILSKYEYNIKYNNQENTVQDNIPEWYNFKLQPFKHQIDGINYGLTHPKFLLADEQGLGKTCQVINLACILKKELGIKHVLIIACVNGLKYNWYEEVLKHSNESPYILGTRYRKNGKEYIGSNEDRLEDIKKLGTDSDIDKHFFIITNIETLRYSKSEVFPLKTKKNGVQKFKKRTVFPIVQELQNKTKDGTIGFIAVDEIHKCLSGDTKVLTKEGLIPICDIVNGKKCEVATYNKDGSVLYVHPSNFFTNPIQQELIKITVQLDNGCEVSFKCTPNHKILTHNRGYVEAKDLCETDDIVECDTVYGG